MHTLMAIAAIWIVVAVVIWIIFIRRYAGKSTDILIPGYLFILGIALWPITVVVGVIFFVLVAIRQAITS